jgi:hypothetical protein
MRKCQVCETELVPASQCTTMICKMRLCSIDCAAIWGKQKAVTQREKAQRKAHSADKERIKTRADWLREAQSAVNSYARARDRGKACISCDKPDNGQHQRHASHYRSVKACSSLRFNLKNIHTSCATCNAVLSGNLLEYRIRLVRQKGPEFVEWLECQNETRAYGIEYLRRLKKIFTKRASVESARKGKLCLNV